MPTAWASLVRMGVIQTSGRPGPSARALGEFALLRVDRPPTPAVYGNRQGGFKVTCPSCSMSLAAPFSAAARRWKGGGAMRLTCPGCGSDWGFTELHYAPPVGFASYALELRDVPSDTLTPSQEVDALLRAALGGAYRVIATRGR